MAASMNLIVNLEFCRYMMSASPLYAKKQETLYLFLVLRGSRNRFKSVCL